jgi:hypothetical protein
LEEARRNFEIKESKKYIEKEKGPLSRERL